MTDIINRIEQLLPQSEVKVEEYTFKLNANLHEVMCVLKDCQAEIVRLRKALENVLTDYKGLLTAAENNGLIERRKMQKKQ